MLVRLFDRSIKGTYKMIAKLAILGSILVSTHAYATSTIQITCEAKVRVQTGFWLYDFEGQATYGSEGFVNFQGNPKLSVTKITVTSDGVQSETYADRASLSKRDDVKGVVLFSLPSSVHGLFLNFFPALNPGDSETIRINHTYAPGQVIETQDKEVKCWTEEIG